MHRCDYNATFDAETEQVYSYWLIANYTEAELVRPILRLCLCYMMLKEAENDYFCSIA